MPVEALAAGGRVIVNSEGGASEGVARSRAALSVDFTDMRSAAEQTLDFLARSPFPDPGDVDWLSRPRFQETLARWVASHSESRANPGPVTPDSPKELS